MATSPMNLDSPPPPAPNVTGQMGGGPEAGVSHMLADKSRERQVPPDMDAINKANPQGAVLARVNALQKVLKELAGLSEQMAPFARRADEILQAGLAAVMKE